MTAPTSPGVVPADVQLLAAEAAVDLAYSGNGTNYKLTRAKIEAVVMADRANRPSLTEDEREKVRREALEEAARSAQAWRVIPDDFIVPGAMTAEELVIARRTAKGIEDHLRALADRSEPRQEKEGYRG